MRAIRFAAHYALRCEEITEQALQQGTLQGISAERLLDEWKRGLGHQQAAFTWWTLFTRYAWSSEFCPLNVRRANSQLNKRLDALWKLVKNNADKQSMVWKVATTLVIHDVEWFERLPLSRQEQRQISHASRCLHGTR